MHRIHHLHPHHQVCGVLLAATPMGLIVLGWVHFQSVHIPFSVQMNQFICVPQPLQGNHSLLSHGYYFLLSSEALRLSKVQSKFRGTQTMCAKVHFGTAVGV
jgi:hypothetical protein